MSPLNDDGSYSSTLCLPSTMMAPMAPQYLPSMIMDPMDPHYVPINDDGYHGSLQYIPPQ